MGCPCLGSAGLRTQRSCAVVRDTSEDRDSVGNLRRICETCFAHECRNVVSEVVSQTLASMLEASDKTVGLRLRSSKVNQVQGVAGFEYPPCLLQCLLHLVCLEVVEHEGGKHSVERRIRIWKLLREPAIQLHVDRFSLGFSPGERERLRIGIEPNNFGLRMKTLDKDREVSGTAAVQISVSTTMGMRAICTSTSNSGTSPNGE